MKFFQKTCLLALPLSLSLNALGDQWFQKMDLGPAWMNTFGDYYQDQKRVGALKGIRINLGDDWYALFDTETLRIVSIYQGQTEWGGTAWTGAHGPLVTLADKKNLTVTAVANGWADADGSFDDKRKIPGYGNISHGNFAGHFLHSREVVLQYNVHGTSVLEHFSRDASSLTRSLKCGSRAKDLTLLLADEASDFTLSADNLSATSSNGLQVLASDGVKLATAPGNTKRLLATIPAGKGDKIFRISFANGSAPKVSPAPDFAKLTAGGPPLWAEKSTTEGKISADAKKPYSTDLATLPEQNPYHASLRFGGFDFIDDNSAALSSWNGDVWVVRGLSGDWKKLEWQRIASGLFEPLGVKVVKGSIYVNGRDQITKLIDLNGDGETDHFQVFNRDVIISPNFHEFTFDLVTDKEGNFYFSKGGPVRGGGRGFDTILPHHGIVAKISPDGKKFEVIARGLRAPGGVGIGPKGQVSTGENEGTWQPCCKINFFTPKGKAVFFGTEPMRGDLTDAAYTEPIVYLPMDIDNSGGSQVWTTETSKFGLKPGEMIHLSYGQSSLYRLLPVTNGGKLHGGVTKLPVNLLSSAMRARFHPDGSLYVLGFRGWQTNAASEAAFQRIRFNPKVGLMVPEKLDYTSKGVNITFPVELDEELVKDISSYAIQRWNYVRGPQYGSGEFSVDNPDQPALDSALQKESQGHKKRDSPKVLSAILAKDGKTVNLEIEGMKPSMSLKISYNLESADGDEITGDIHASVHK